MNEPKLANVLEKLGAIFGVYGEWGQPIHDVGNDVRILGLPIRRPDTAAAFRMLCRHNRYVQEFGKVRDADEVARRERVWEETIDALEFETGRQVASMPRAGVPPALRRRRGPQGLRVRRRRREAMSDDKGAARPSEAARGRSSSPRSPASSCRIRHFMKAMEGAMRGKQKLDEAAARALKTMNVPTRTRVQAGGGEHRDPGGGAGAPRCEAPG